MSLLTLFVLVHLVGLSLAVGSATLKVVLLLKCRSDYSFIPTFLKIARPATNLIVTGLILLTLTGIGWLIYGYPIGTEMIIKLVLVGSVWVMGPVIDNVFEPKFRNLAPSAGQSAAPEFVGAYNSYITIEIIATAVFYVIIVLWVLAVS